jgi:hypothetical protein
MRERAVLGTKPVLGPLERAYAAAKPDATKGLVVCAFLQQHRGEWFTKGDLARRTGCSPSLVSEVLRTCATQIKQSTTRPVRHRFGAVVDLPPPARPARAAIDRADRQQPRGAPVPTVDIQPPNDIYATFGRLNYKPWYAIAEFVDNATQNFFYNAKVIAAADGEAYLDIDITYDKDTNVLEVTDNAHGMELEELTRAMRIASPPPDRSGRSEFGMGMKTAACWFGSRWSVTTTQLGSTSRLEVIFDVEELAASGAPALDVHVTDAEAEEHGTTIRIENLRKPIVGRQIERIRKTLTSMYRHDLVSGTIQITWNGRILEWVEPPLWQQERPDGALAELRQPLHLTVVDPATGDEHTVTGWVGVLATMSNTDTGFALFRRDRLIIGGPGEGWRPTELCGTTGSPEWKRIVGELHMNTFPVNFTKDGFAWESGLEEELIKVLAPLVTTYRRFASDLRVRPKGGAATAADFVRVVDEVQAGVSEPELKRELVVLGTPPPPGEERLSPELSIDAATELVPRALEVPVATGTLKANLYLKDEGKHAVWLSIQSISNDDIDIILNTAHPFVAACTEDERGTVVLGKFALALALAEQQSRVMHGECIPAEEVRMYLSSFLLHSKP